MRGVLVTWAQDARLPANTLSGLRRVAQDESLHEDFRLMLVLKLLNPEMPLIYQGDIVTPKWLLDHPLEGYVWSRVLFPTCSTSWAPKCGSLG